MSTFTLTSNLVADRDAIPNSAAHDSVGGNNVSPHLSWRGAPLGTQSYAITCYDPDEPTGVGFVHWILFNVSPDCTELAPGAGAPGHEPTGSTLGFTDWGENRYGGMAPSVGDPPHGYVFTVYALGHASLDGGATVTYAMLQYLMRGAVLGTATLIGLYELS
ncbi:MAG: YbhB/YbcL family Raf kinase inhibitor-like protein [Solirubrobacteraceae bacterium]